MLGANFARIPDTFWPRHRQTVSESYLGVYSTMWLLTASRTSRDHLAAHFQHASMIGFGRRCAHDLYPLYHLVSTFILQRHARNNNVKAQDFPDP